MGNKIFDSVFNTEEKKLTNLRKGERQQDEEFARERDQFAASVNDEALPIKENGELGDLTRWQQDLSGEIDTLIHDLRREHKENGKWKKESMFIGYKDGEEVHRELPPIINELGIQTVVSLLKPLLSRNLMMSNYKEERIFMKLRRVISTLIIHLGYNYRLYQIEKTDLDSIVQMFKDIIEPTHFRALNNGERTFLNTTTKRMETHSVDPPRQNSSNKKWGVFN